jgi:chorismate-pyruvate lyase
MPENSSIAPPPPAHALAHPLDEFYADLGLPLLPMTAVDGAAVPEPYKTLLVHQDDMTPTLEGFYGGNLLLKVLGRRRKNRTYSREVVLLLEGTNQPVEFGAIKIDLALFPDKARAEILREELPLGRILREHAIAHSSRPRAFLRLASDRLINSALDLTGAQVLYGRCNSLLDPRGRSLAEVVEILPVSARPSAAAHPSKRGPHQR